MIQISYSDKLLDKSRETQDVLADEVVAAFFPARKKELQAMLSEMVDNGYTPADDAPGIFQKLWQDVYRNELLTEKKVLKKGQEFFSRNSSDLMLLLGLLSLPYCYAAAKGAEVLIRSNRIKDEPEKRLLETAQFVFDVMASDAFEINGKGLASLLKVRLMHATIRYYVQQDPSWLPAYGKPVNQEDQAGTNLSFSLIPIRGLRNLGRTVSASESMSYIRYWNVIGRLLGVRPELLPDSAKAANLLERKIRKRQFKSSEAGIALTSSLLNYFERATRGTELDGKSRPFVQFLLGDSISELLGVEVDGFSKTLFQPVSQMMKFRNIFLSKDDNYQNSLKRFTEQKTGVTEEVTFGLPAPIVASDAS